jgi:phosphate transport system substrate-binding protein
MTKGDKLALDLDYVPLPKKTIEQVMASWKELRDENGKAVLAAK